MYYSDPMNVECGLSNSQFDIYNNEICSQQNQQNFIECSIAPEYINQNKENPRQELEYTIDSTGLLTTHGISICSCGNLDGSYDFAITLGDNIVPEDAFLQMNVFGLDGQKFYNLLDEFALNHNEEQFKLAEVAKFFESKGYKVASCR
jgi:hypothetical protein